MTDYKKAFPLITACILFPILLLGSSCSILPISTGPTVLQVGGGVSALVAPSSSGATAGAQISGTLIVLGENCLGFSDSSGDQALVFAAGTTALEDGTGVETPEGVEVRLGDFILGAGGRREIDPQDNWVAQRWPTAPTGCTSAAAASGMSDVEVE